MKVVQFLRKPVEFYSVERVFEDIRPALPEDIDVCVYVNPFPSRGLWYRVLGMLSAARHQGDINHITGDIHFLNILMRKRKTILTILDCVSLERTSGIKYMILWFFWYWLPAKRAAAITVISKSTKKELEAHLGPGDWPVTVIRCPVSPEFTFSQPGGDWGCPRILQVGTTANKNVERVAAALKGMRCKLVIIGPLSPSQLQALAANEIDYESHVGISRAAIVEEYRKCDIVMFASLYEGFGLPILEAQAVGRPVITSNLYSMPEVGGDGACYVDPLSIEEIRAAAEKIVNDEDYRSALVQRGLANAEKFSAEVIAQQYAGLYRRVYERRLK